MPEVMNEASYSKKDLPILEREASNLAAPCFAALVARIQINSHQTPSDYMPWLRPFLPVAPRRRAGVASRESSDWVAEIAGPFRGQLVEIVKAIEHQGQIQK